jgi:hypothetical protein
MKGIQNQTGSKKKTFIEIIIFAAMLFFPAALMIGPIALAFVVVYLAKNLNIELGHRLNVSNNSIALMMMGEFGLLALLLIKFELIILKRTNFIEALKKWLTRK